MRFTTLFITIALALSVHAIHMKNGKGKMVLSQEDAGTTAVPATTTQASTTTPAATTSTTATTPAAATSTSTKTDAPKPAAESKKKEMKWYNPMTWFAENEKTK